MILLRPPTLFPFITLCSLSLAVLHAVRDCSKNSQNVAFFLFPFLCYLIFDSQGTLIFSESSILPNRSCFVSAVVYLHGKKKKTFHFRTMQLWFFSTGSSACTFNNFKELRDKCSFLLDYTVFLAELIIHRKQVIVPYCKHPQSKLF